jgi:amino acid adenylation domain
MNYFMDNGAHGAAIGSRSQNEVHYVRERSVHDVFRERVAARPDAMAVSFGDRSLTYCELDRRSDALAADLVRRGVSKGDVVALAVPRSLATVIAKLAVLKAGGAYLPIDPAFPPDHLRYVIGECRPKVIFVDDAHEDQIRTLSVASSTVVNLEAVPPTLTPVPSILLPQVYGGDVAYVMYTSGSTGRPKGVAIPHRGITRLVLDQNYIDVSPADVVLHTATISFDATTFEVWSALLNGAALIGMPKASFSLGDLCAVIRDNNVTVALLTTGMFNLVADLVAESLPSLRQVLFGGEAGSAEHVRRFQAAHPHCVLTNAYGPTECSVIATTFTVPANFQGRELPIGKPIAHTTILILDENMRSLPPGTEGQLALAGDGLAVGYINRPDLTDEKFVMIETTGGPMRCYLTGDLAVIEEDGTVFFKGRNDRQIKINGKRIELDQIEAAVRRDHGVMDGVVTCHTQGPSLKRIVTYIRPKNASDLANPDFVWGFMERLRHALPEYMIPSTAIVMAELPLTPAGKVDRAKLPVPTVEAEKSAVPESRNEELLTRLWRDVLGIEDVPLDSNFFDLGGTSLQLLRVQAGLMTELGRDVDLALLFKHPTVRELARCLDGKIAKAAPAITAAERAALQRKSMSQFRRSP